MRFKGENNACPKYIDPARQFNFRVSSRYVRFLESVSIIKYVTSDRARTWQRGCWGVACADIWNLL